MIRSRLPILVAPFALAATFEPSPARAADRYAVVGIENPTAVTISLQYRWGDAEWKTEVLKPGERVRFWWTQARVSDDRAPRFYMRFDSDLNPGKVAAANYELQKNAAPTPDWEYAHKYTFQYDGDRNALDLFEK